MDTNDIRINDDNELIYMVDLDEQNIIGLYIRNKNEEFNERMMLKSFQAGHQPRHRYAMFNSEQLDDYQQKIDLANEEIKLSAQDLYQQVKDMKTMSFPDLPFSLSEMSGQEAREKVDEYYLSVAKDYLEKFETLNLAEKAIREEDDQELLKAFYEKKNEIAASFIDDNIFANGVLLEYMQDYIDQTRSPIYFSDGEQVEKTLVQYSNAGSEDPVFHKIFIELGDGSKFTILPNAVSEKLEPYELSTFVRVTTDVVYNEFETFYSPILSDELNRDEVAYRIRSGGVVDEFLYTVDSDDIRKLPDKLKEFIKEDPFNMSSNNYEIVTANKNGIDLDKFYDYIKAEEDMIPEKIRAIRVGLEAGYLDEEMKMITEPEYSPQQLKEISMGIAGGLSINEVILIADPAYDSEAMKYAINLLYEDVPADVIKENILDVSRLANSQNPDEGNIDWDKQMANDEKLGYDEESISYMSENKRMECIKETARNMVYANYQKISDNSEEYLKNHLTQKEEIQMDNVDIKVKGVKILSVDEANQIDGKLLREVAHDHNFWLSSFGAHADYKAYIDNRGEVKDYGTDGTRSIMDIHPLLEIESSSKLPDGTKIESNGEAYFIVCDGKYALKSESIDEDFFHRGKGPHDNFVGLEYENSNLKRKVDEWFEGQTFGFKLSSEKETLTNGLKSEDNAMIDKNSTEYSHTPAENIEADIKQADSLNDIARNQLEIKLADSLNDSINALKELQTKFGFTQGSQTQSQSQSQSSGASMKMS